MKVIDKGRKYDCYKNNEISKKYKTKRWKKLREYILKRDKYLCQDAIRYGKSVEATTVHHIFPASEYPELFYNPDNLISLSTAAHNAMHDRATNEISKKGKELQKRKEVRIFGQRNN